MTHLAHHRLAQGCRMTKLLPVVVIVHIVHTALGIPVEGIEQALVAMIVTHPNS